MTSEGAGRLDITVLTFSTYSLEIVGFSPIPQLRHAHPTILMWSLPLRTRISLDSAPLIGQPCIIVDYRMEGARLNGEACVIVVYRVGRRVRVNDAH